MNIRIDISNYEEYVIDYMEGTLAGDALESFQAFLLAHPEIAREIDEMAEADLQLEADDSIAFDTSSLKMNAAAVGSIDTNNYEEYFAESVGHFLNKEEEKAVQDFVTANPALEKDFRLYQMTALKPNMAVQFDGKRGLKQPVPLWEAAPKFAYRAAAILILALGAWTVLQTIETRTYNPRQGGIDFASLDFEWSLPSTMDADQAQPQMAQIDPEPATQTTTQTTTQTNKRIQLNAMPVLNAADQTPATASALMASVADWDLAPYAVSSALPDEPMVAPHKQQPEELTLAQYLGREFLGVDPKDAPTTKALLRESVNKVAPKNEQFAIHSEAGDNDRKTLHILAGAIEFKRVNYTKN